MTNAAPVCCALHITFDCTIVPVVWSRTFVVAQCGRMYKRAKAAPPSKIEAAIAKTAVDTQKKKSIISIVGISASIFLFVVVALVVVVWVALQTQTVKNRIIRLIAPDVVLPGPNGSSPLVQYDSIDGWRFPWYATVRNVRWHHPQTREPIAETRAVHVSMSPFSYLSTGQIVCDEAVFETVDVNSSLFLWDEATYKAPATQDNVEASMPLVYALGPQDGAVKLPTREQIAAMLGNRPLPWPAPGADISVRAIRVANIQLAGRVFAHAELSFASQKSRDWQTEGEVYTNAMLGTGSGKLSFKTDAQHGTQRTSAQVRWVDADATRRGILDVKAKWQDLFGLVDSTRQIEDASFILAGSTLLPSTVAAIGIPVDISGAAECRVTATQTFDCHTIRLRSTPDVQTAEAAEDDDLLASLAWHASASAIVDPTQGLMAMPRSVVVALRSNVHKLDIELACIGPACTSGANWHDGTQLGTAQFTADETGFSGHMHSPDLERVLSATSVIVHPDADQSASASYGQHFDSDVSDVTFSIYRPDDQPANVQALASIWHVDVESARHGARAKIVCIPKSGHVESIDGNARAGSWRGVRFADGFVHYDTHTGDMRLSANDIAMGMVRFAQAEFVGQGVLPSLDMFWQSKASMQGSLVIQGDASTTQLQLDAVHDGATGEVVAISSAGIADLGFKTVSWQDKLPVHVALSPGGNLSVTGTLYDVETLRQWLYLSIDGQGGYAFQLNEEASNIVSLARLYRLGYPDTHFALITRNLFETGFDAQGPVQVVGTHESLVLSVENMLARNAYGELRDIRGSWDVREDGPILITANSDTGHVVLRGGCKFVDSLANFDVPVRTHFNCEKTSGASRPTQIRIESMFFWDETSLIPTMSAISREGFTRRDSRAVIAHIHSAIINSLASTPSSKSDASVDAQPDSQ